MRDIKEEIYNRVYKFMIDNEIDCDDTIYQCDGVIESAYEFIADLFKIIESDLPIEEPE